MVENIEFCRDWDAQQYGNRPESDQEAYVASELQRLTDEEKPVLRAVLNCPDDWCKFIAMNLLTVGATADGTPVPSLPMVYLRLVDPSVLDYEHPGTGEVEKGAAVPPSRDPQGRPLPKDKVGKVLVAKVGNLGGNIPTNREASQAKAFGGDRRLSLGKAGHTLFVTREVTRTPAPYPLRDAVLILQSWGFGVGDVVFRSLRSADRSGQRARGLCQWLVEEVPEEAALVAIAAAKAKGKTKAPKESE